MGARQSEQDAGEPLNLTYKAAAAKIGISLSMLYELLRDGELRKLDFGPQVKRIPMTEIEAYQARKKAEQWGAEPGTAA